MTEKKRKRFYWLFKILSVIISCALPIFAIWEKFPMWTYNHGTVRSVGVGGILVLFVILVVFRRAVFKFIRDRLKLRHAPPLAVWLVMLIISYIMVYLGNVMQDMTTVFWMGLIGCAIGTTLTYIAENHFGEVNRDE
jgi:ABC-type xylose transport system permease subunit